MAGLNVTSEIGVLKRVILHTPGPEVEAMTPKEADADLYNDIIPLSAVRSEYDVLKAFLSSVSEVFELKDILAQVLADTGSKFEFISSLSKLCPVKRRVEELMAKPPAELARLVIEGLPAEPESLAHFVAPRSFSLRPLPNTYFMRDSAAVIRDYAVSSATAFDVRLIESIITRFVFRHNNDFRARGILFDGPEERSRAVTIEGGDIIILSPQALAVGLSERSTPEAVERLAIAAVKAFGEPFSVYAVILPKERACIHLDMIFTVIDRDAALVYGPLITGSRRARVVRVDARRDGSLSFTEEAGLIEGLGRAGIELEPVLCAGGDGLHEEREQWWSGANSFAFAPGKIMMYSCNVRTLDALSAAGFEIRSARDFLSGGEKPGDCKRLAVGFDGIELARGGGGARCMTMPVEREDLD